MLLLFHAQQELVPTYYFIVRRVYSSSRWWFKEIFTFCFLFHQYSVHSTIAPMFCMCSYNFNADVIHNLVIFIFGLLFYGFSYKNKSFKWPALLLGKCQAVRKDLASVTSS
jgi:hypothetical protein